MSFSGQPQFRYTQTPSKVLHLRNLPWECMEEELVELCKPFGKIVNTKSNVGANRNQAFVEFVDLNQAILMVSYYSSSSDPAQGVEAGDVSIDVIHLALIQFTDAETASAARNALDGRSIPRYLLPEHVISCHLRISYSAHTNLNIKFQSHRSRDYTNPYLPVNPLAIENTLQPVPGPEGKTKEPESNVLLASIENMQYAVTVDVLHTVFSAFGTIQKITIFEKNGGMQALIQYPDVTTATVSKEALEGHCIYDGGYCKLHLSYSRHTDLNVQVQSVKSRDYTIPDLGVLSMPQPPAVPAGVGSWQGASQAPAVYGTPMPTWDPNIMGDRPDYPRAPSVYMGQTYVSSSLFPYSTSGPHPTTSELRQASQFPPYGTQPDNRPSALPPSVGQPPLHY